MTTRPDRTALGKAIARWFRCSARDLPWRTTPRNPYLSLVSEFMLQQTQVRRVLEKWDPFVRRFPDIASLAAAPEQEVLALWSGLGYYRRARNLHAAAKVVVGRFGGEVPTQVAELRTLPGVGRYTAGAISSIVFNRREPIVDGNVARVLMRVSNKPLVSGSPTALDWAWKEAAEVVQAAARSRVSVAAVNEGLMELGATVCTPRNPDCTACPARFACVAFRKGIQERVPAPKPLTRRESLYCEVVVVRHRRGILVEKRPASGMWASLWQAPTWERAERVGHNEVAAWFGVRRVRPGDEFVHQTTHRVVHFRVWTAPAPRRRPGRVYLGEDKIAQLPLSNPQRRILLGAGG